MNEISLRIWYQTFRDFFKKSAALWGGEWQNLVDFYCAVAIITCTEHLIACNHLFIPHPPLPLLVNSNIFYL